MIDSHRRALAHMRVRVLADSLTASGYRLQTLRVRFPRYLLAEVNTHGLINRSAGSSRAVPVKRRVRETEDRPWVPEFRVRRAGMQAGGLPDSVTQAVGLVVYGDGLRAALRAADKLDQLGLHKQYANRLLEPFCWVEAVWTAAHWDNFLALRAHPDADPGFAFLARAVYLALTDSEPTRLESGEWHLPFIGPDDRLAAAQYAAEVDRRLWCRPSPFPDSLAGLLAWTLCRWSAARCARASYELFDGRPSTPESDDRTWASLVGADRNDPDDVQAAALGHWNRSSIWPYRPLHASPMQHIACPWEDHFPERWRSNLSPGFLQFRKVLPGESIAQFRVPPDTEAAWREEIPPEVVSGPWEPAPAEVAESPLTKE